MSIPDLAFRSRRSPSTSHWLATACLAGVATSALSATTTLSLDPKATYLSTNADAAPSSVAVPLASLGVTPGDRIELTRLGEWDNGPGADQFTSLIAVFSASDAILPSSQLNRIPDALDAGVDFPSPLTYFGGIPTDIPQDFVISSGGYPSGTICVVVPQGATHIFFSTADSYFSDNIDADGDWGVAVTLLGSCAADLDGDGGVTAADLAVLLGAWGPHDVIGAPGDLDCDGEVDAADLAILLGAWGTCPG